MIVSTAIACVGHGRRRKRLTKFPCIDNKHCMRCGAAGRVLAVVLLIRSNCRWRRFVHDSGSLDRDDVVSDDLLTVVYIDDDTIIYMETTTTTPPPPATTKTTTTTGTENGRRSGVRKVEVTSFECAFPCRRRRHRRRRSKKEANTNCSQDK